MKKKYEIQKVLFINGNREESRRIEKALQHYCSTPKVFRAGDTREGLEMLAGEDFDAVFADIRPSADCLNFPGKVREINVCIPVIVLVGKGKEIHAAEALKKGAFDYLILGTDYMNTLPPVLERIEGMSVTKNEREAELEERSPLFKQIYRSQKWWQNIIDSITDYLFVIDRNYRILRTNKAFAGLFGREPADIIMKPYYELFGMDGPHEWCSLTDNMEKLAPRSIERSLNDAVYLISSFPIYFDNHDAVVYIMKDITETRRLKDQIYHLDKLSSLGTLTSGVAHEINNPLTGIIGYTEMMLMKEDGKTRKKYLRNVYDAAIRCKRIVENMLTFSRQTPAQKNPEDINEIIDNTIELHEYWLKSTNIEIVRSYSEVPYVAVDRQQMQQVILNLLINAEHAISDTDRRGRIEFKTVYDDKEKLTIITISDNGRGIPQDTLPKIFDPFFTTKPVNKGTGLGLSIAHGIVAEQGGTIEAKSEPDKGTVFIIKLPQSK